MYWSCEIDSQKHDFKIITKLWRLIYSTRIQVEVKGGTENGPGSFLYTVLYEKDKCYFFILIFMYNSLCYSQQSTKRFFWIQIWTETGFVLN